MKQILFIFLMLHSFIFAQNIPDLIDSYIKLNDKELITQLKIAAISDLKQEKKQKQDLRIYIEDIDLNNRTYIITFKLQKIPQNLMGFSKKNMIKEDTCSQKLPKYLINQRKIIFKYIYKDDKDKIIFIIDKCD